MAVLGAKELDFHAAKTIQIEVWMPGSNRFAPVAICSAQETFIARENAIRFRTHDKEKPQYAQTFTVSIDVGEALMNAILENGQNEDGTVSIPKVLLPYAGFPVIQRPL